MPARLIPLDELTEADIAIWRELAAEAVEPNPFWEPAFVLPAAEILPDRGLGLLVVESGGTWTACLPAIRRRAWSGTPVKGTAAWAHIYCFLGTPLVRADALAAFAPALLAATVAARESSFLGLPLLATSDPVAGALAAAAAESGLRRVCLRTYDRAFLRRREEPKQYVALRPKHRREFRRLGDRLCERLEAPLEVRDEADSDAAIDDFLRLEASGWKGRHGTAFASLDGHARFFRKLCHGFRELGRLQLLVLRADGRPLAAKCNLRGGEGLFCFKIAFDEQLARFSPGIQLELRNIDHFHDDHQLQWMDSCAEATNEMINRLWPDRRRIEIVAYTGGVRGVVARNTLRGARWAREMTRRKR